MKITTEKEIKQYQETEKELKKLAKLLKCGIFEVAETLEKLINHIEKLEQERNSLQEKLNKGE